MGAIKVVIGCRINNTLVESQLENKDDIRPIPRQYAGRSSLFGP
jgi:hypothetical protein